jgi:ligand-binding sensor domain-containing protein
VKSLAVLAPDDVWLADGCDLFRWDGRRWTRLPTGFHANDILVAKGRILASGTENDWVTQTIRQWRENRWEPLGVKPEGRISSLVADDRGRVWIGTDRGEVMRLDL